jgi:GGDEF domain-containing protein
MEKTLAYWRHLAETDELTDLPNRRALERRTHARNGWFVLCDLNGFKYAQDRHPDGHAYGDTILCEFARYITNGYRLHGDEFVIWCPTESEAKEIQQRIHAWRSSDGMVTCSAGVGKTLAAADQAMYLDKEAK